jgi:hypothetical protein
MAPVSHQGRVRSSGGRPPAPPTGGRTGGPRRVPVASVRVAGARGCSGRQRHRAGRAAGGAGPAHRPGPARARRPAARRRRGPATSSAGRRRRRPRGRAAQAAVGAAQLQADLGQQVGELDVEGVADRGEQLGGGLLLPRSTSERVAQADPGGTGDVAQRPTLAQPVAAQGRAELGAQAASSPSPVLPVRNGGTPGRWPCAHGTRRTDGHLARAGRVRSGVNDRRPGGPSPCPVRNPRGWGGRGPSQAAASVRGPPAGPAERRAAAARMAGRWCAAAPGRGGRSPGRSPR